MKSPEGRVAAGCLRSQITSGSGRLVTTCGGVMISDGVRAALKEEGSAAFVTQGASGPHLVATWNSYIEVVDSSTLVFPAGGYRETEQNLRSGSPVQMLIGGHVPQGVGYRLTGRAELEVDTPHHVRLKQRFPWSRAAVVLHVSGVEQVLGK
jgi:hypothetical protein